ncbi:hypothetical protein G6F24_017220 [Rhizopus arrhizus]|nr:hypothetical protein G6F24_017220 [Rhizopus arrhizus]
MEAELEQHLAQRRGFERRSSIQQGNDEREHGRQQMRERQQRSVVRRRGQQRTCMAVPQRTQQNDQWHLDDPQPAPRVGREPGLATQQHQPGQTGGSKTGEERSEQQIATPRAADTHADPVASCAQC